jgi:hypothetical protein
MLHPPDHGVTTSEGSLAGVRPALDSHGRSAEVFIQSTVRIDHNRCLIASHGVFSGQLANQAVGYEFRRCDTAAELQASRAATRHSQ